MAQNQEHLQKPQLITPDVKAAHGWGRQSLLVQQTLSKGILLHETFGYQALWDQAGLVTVDSNTENIQCEVCKISWRTWEMSYVIQEVSRKHDIPDLFHGFYIPDLFHGFYSYQAWFRILVAMQFLSQPEKKWLSCGKSVLPFFVCAKLSWHSSTV